jgi:hypothetical protein
MSTDLRIGSTETALGVDRDDYKPKPTGYDAAAIQPKPTGDGVDVAVVAADHLRALGHIKIAEDIEARIRLGERKYGTRLKSHNGRDAMLDLYQEVLDGINYAQQCKIEGLDDGGLLFSMIGMAVWVSEKMRKAY